MAIPPNTKVSGILATNFMKIRDNQYFVTAVTHDWVEIETTEGKYEFGLKNDAYAGLKTKGQLEYADEELWQGEIANIENHKSIAWLKKQGYKPESLAWINIPEKKQKEDTLLDYLKNVLKGKKKLRW